MEKSWGSSDQSVRQSFRASLGMSRLSPLHSPGISPSGSPRLSPKFRPRNATWTPLKNGLRTAGKFQLNLPADTVDIGKTRRRLTKSLCFSQSVDEEWEVFQKVMEMMKLKLNVDKEIGTSVD